MNEEKTQLQKDLEGLRRIVKGEIIIYVHEVVPNLISRHKTYAEAQKEIDEKKFSSDAIDMAIYNEVERQLKNEAFNQQIKQS